MLVDRRGAMALVAQAQRAVAQAYRASARLTAEQRYETLATARILLARIAENADVDTAVTARAAEAVRTIELVEVWAVLEPSGPELDAKSAEERRLGELLREMLRIANGLSAIAPVAASA